MNPQAILDDLRNLTSSDLPADSFQTLQRTKIQLPFSYCHLIEITSNVLLADLLRLRTGLNPRFDPFEKLTPFGRKSGLVLKSRAPSPSQKIERIELAQKAKVAVDSIFDSIYDSDMPKRRTYRSNSDSPTPATPSRFSPYNLAS